MKEIKNKVTESEDFTNTYTGKYANYHQFHIYSLPTIYSTYYNPEIYTIAEVQEIAESKLAKIKQRGNNSNNISLFARNGQFIISEYSAFIDPACIMIFDQDRGCYVYDDYYDTAEDVIEDAKIDEFIIKGLTTVGAFELLEELKPFIQKLKANNDHYLDRNEKLRELNKSNPTLKLEFYRIEKNYKPVLVETIPIHSKEAVHLPEYYELLKLDKRISYLIKDLTTDKIVDGNLEEDIEGLKYQKWFNKNPAIIDANDMMRMELDSDDPDFLSYNDLRKNDDELEEGDDEYSPY